MGLALESFDAEAPAEDPAIADAYQRGLEAGREQALAESGAVDAALKADVLSTLSDLGFTRAEARAEVLRSLQPFFHTLASKLVPSLLQESFGPTLVSALMVEADRLSRQPMTLYLPPGAAELVAPVSQNLSGLPLEILCDDSLAAGTARWSSAESEALFDTGPLLRDLQDAILALATKSANTASGTRAATKTSRIGGNSHGR